MEYLKKTSLILTLIGALNWGFVGFFDFNLVSFLFGMGILTRIIYMLVGLSALVVMYAAATCCPIADKVDKTIKDIKN